ncbi:cbs domain protein [Phlyctema vagabunda]|uniref:Cbs domain protein n=1 Tax=Phlyctema vagabunda TaxID=108571 RepID=A0ABR4PT20_9HELO
MKMTDPTTPLETPPRTHTASPGNLAHQTANSHRSSFAEMSRQSPRAQRHPSFTQAAVQELLNHPPAPKTADPQFAGRDWRQIHVGELVQHRDIRFVQLDTGVEEATKLLCESGPPNVVLLRENPNDTRACGTFDFSDLNAYLLVVLGLASPEEDQKGAFAKIQENAQGGSSIALRDISMIFRRDPLITLPESADLSKATEIFGSGVHRILICKEGTSDVIGILSQLKLVKFLWDNASSFPIIEQLYPVILNDLGIGTQQTIAINGDKPLTEALQLMSQEGLSSLAVVDNSFNVVGNISTADTRLLTTTSSMPLLKSSCIHFISVILSEKGVENGRDSYPGMYLPTAITIVYHVVALQQFEPSSQTWLTTSSQIFGN